VGCLTIPEKAGDGAICDRESRFGVHQKRDDCGGRKEKREEGGVRSWPSRGHATSVIGKKREAEDFGCWRPAAIKFDAGREGEKDECSFRCQIGLVHS